MISIFLPSIRTHLLEGFYNSLELNCHYPFEVVVCGPFTPPQSLLAMNNFTFIKDYGCPTRSAQLAAIKTKYELIYHTTDDCVFLPDAINRSIGFFTNNCRKTDMLGMPYREGRGHGGVSNSLEYWSIANSDYRTWETLDKSWKLNCHFVMYKEYFMEVGGFDSTFQYLNHACHDLEFRVQQHGGTFFVGTGDVTSADWNPGTQEHKPIADTQILRDSPIFHDMWFNGNKHRYKISVDNWKESPELWSTRFGNSRPSSYKELYN